MRSLWNSIILTLVGVLVFSSAAIAQMPQPQQATGENSKWIYNGRNRVAGSGGPAPVHDLSGTWAGPRSGAGVPDFRVGEIPSLTPLGQELFSGRKSLAKFSPAGTNDPFVRTCDPLGFPRADVDEIRGISFATMPDRIVMLYQFQQVWREIWMDGRELPKNAGPPKKERLTRDISDTRWAIGKGTIRSLLIPQASTIGVGSTGTGIRIASRRTCRNASPAPTTTIWN